MSWFSSLFHRPATLAPTEPDPQIEKLAAELADCLQKLTRTQARQGVRLEEIENKLESGFSDLRTLAQKTTPASASAIRWDDLLDAADALDEAARTASAANDGPMADGLGVIAARINRFLAGVGMRRDVRVGVPPDPAIVRVVGSVEASHPAEGLVARVVRAAVTDKGRLVREGEVLIAHSSPATAKEQASP